MIENPTLCFTGHRYYNATPDREAQLLDALGTPKKDDWVEIEGKFRVDKDNNPYLEVIKLTVKAEPGQINVFS